MSERSRPVARWPVALAAGRVALAGLAGALDRPAALPVVLVVGLILRLVALALLVELPLVSDARSYHEMALQLRRGEPFIPYWPPGLPVYLATVQTIFGQAELVSRTAMLIFYPALILPLYALARQVAARRVAVVVVLLISLYPSFVHQAVEPLTHMPVAAGLAALLWLTLRAIQAPQWPTLLTLGGVLGSLALVRPSSLLLMLLVPGFLLVRTRHPARAVVPLAVAGTLVTAWLLAAHGLTGEWVPINYANSQNFFFGNNPHTPLYKTWWLGSHKAGEPEVPAAYTALLAEMQNFPMPVQDTRYRQIALDHIAARPDLFLVRTLSRVRVSLALDPYSGAMLLKDYHVSAPVGWTILALDSAFGLGILALALFGLWPDRAQRLPGETLALLLGITLIYALPYWLAFAYPVYRLPVMPLLAILAAVAGPRLTAVVRRAWRRDPVRPLLIRQAGLLLALFAIQVEWVVALSGRL